MGLRNAIREIRFALPQRDLGAFPLADVTDEARVHALIDAVDLPLFPWHTAPKPHVVRIEPMQVTGRRFRVGVPAAHPARRRAAEE